MSAAPTVIPVRLSVTAVLAAASMGVWRAWRVRAASEKTREFPDRMRRMWADDIIGCIGECAFSIACGFRWTPTLGSDAERGDVHGAFIKTTLTDPPMLIYRPTCDHNDRAYVLVTGNGFDRWAVLGWQPGHACQRPEWFKKDHRPAYWVPADQLRSWPPSDSEATYYHLTLKDTQ